MKNYVLDEELMHDLESIHDLCASYAGCHTGMVEGAFGELETMLDSVIFDIKQRAIENAWPVCRGHWVRKYDELGYWYDCSECGMRACRDNWGLDCESNFCPYCGADMRRRSDD